MRALVAAGLAMALQWAAIWAPLVHAHPDDHDDHHDGPAVHAHLAGHSAKGPSTRPALGEDDHERAIYLQLFVALTPASLADVATPVAVVDVAPPSERAAHRPVHVVHGHDPPLRRSIPARAPPASLS